MKEIRKLKLALTSSCTLRCNHCNIDKNSGLELDFKKAAAGADLLLSSPGQFKRLEIYGGEPFLKFDLVKEISSYARKKAKEKDKRLSLSIATNATVLDEEKIEWIRDNRINVSVSFSGSPESHNYNRIFPDGRGSYRAVSKNINKLLKKIPPEYAVCLYCVDGGFAGNMEKDFNLILEKGFRIINVECVSGRGWSGKNYNDFEIAMVKMADAIQGRISAGDFIYFEPFIELFRNRRKYFSPCPVTGDMEIYPDGKIGFYPYPFIDYQNIKNKVSAGDWKRGLKLKYIRCEYGGKECKKCLKSYYFLEKLYDGAYAYSIRTRIIERLFFDILKERAVPGVKRYISKLREIIDMTYE